MRVPPRVSRCSEGTVQPLCHSPHGAAYNVMPGLVPGIHDLLASKRQFEWERNEGAGWSGNLTDTTLSQSVILYSFSQARHDSRLPNALAPSSNIFFALQNSMSNISREVLVPLCKVLIFLRTLCIARSMDLAFSCSMLNTCRLRPNALIRKVRDAMRPPGVDGSLALNPILMRRGFSWTPRT